MNSHYRHIDIRHFAITMDQLKVDSNSHPFEPVVIHEDEEGSFFKRAEGWHQAIIRDLTIAPSVKLVVERFQTILGKPLMDENQQLLTDVFAARYYRQMRGVELPWHCDHANSTATVNFLFDDNNQPFTFQDIGDIPYSCCLFNVGRTHMVRAADSDRLIFRVCPLDITYDQLIPMMQRSGMFL